MIQVLLADDHQVVRQGLKALLEREGFHVVAEASDGQQAVQLAKQFQPDVAVLDLAMPILNGLDAAREIQKVSEKTKPIILNYTSFALKGYTETRRIRRILTTVWVGCRYPWRPSRMPLRPPLPRSTRERSTRAFLQFNSYP